MSWKISAVIHALAFACPSYLKKIASNMNERGFNKLYKGHFMGEWQHRLNTLDSLPSNPTSTTGIQPSVNVSIYNAYYTSWHKTFSLLRRAAQPSLLSEKFTELELSCSTEVMV